jgi:hypothetical protein
LLSRNSKINQNALAKNNGKFGVWDLPRGGLGTVGIFGENSQVSRNRTKNQGLIGFWKSLKIALTSS